LPTMFNEAHVLCPFYKFSATTSITCEGITDDSDLKLFFKDKKRMRFHREVFCCSKYKNCELYSMLEKKYEE
jgi:hypothetical protein